MNRAEPRLSATVFSGFPDADPMRADIDPSRTEAAA